LGNGRTGEGLASVKVVRVEREGGWKKKGPTKGGQSGQVFWQSGTKVGATMKGKPVGGGGKRNL